MANFDKDFENFYRNLTPVQKLCDSVSYMCNIFQIYFLSRNIIDRD